MKDAIVISVLTLIVVINTGYVCFKQGQKHPITKLKVYWNSVHTTAFGYDEDNHCYALWSTETNNYGSYSLWERME